jgi:hypothetical protein
LEKKEVAMPVKTIQILGAGATGSHLAYLCSQESDVFEANVIVWEADTIEHHNIRVSQYRKGDVGKPKLDTLQEVLENKNGFKLTPIPKFWEPKEILYECDFLILAVDKMPVRKALINSYFEMYPKSDAVVIDPRLGSDEIQVISFLKDDVEEWDKEWYFEPSEVYKPDDGEACRILKTPPHLSMRLACEIYGIINKQSATDCFIEKLVFRNFD